LQGGALTHATRVSWDD